MLRISETLKKTSELKKKKGASKKDGKTFLLGSAKTADFEETAFAQMLSHKNWESRTGLSLDEVLESLDQAANTVIQNPSEKSIEAYVSLIKSFLEKTVPEYSRVRERVIRKKLSSKVLMILDTVDEKLKQLTDEIMKKQAGGLAASALFVDIKGLLVDLLR